MFRADSAAQWEPTTFFGDVGKFGIAGLAGLLIASDVAWQDTVLGVGGLTIVLGLGFWIVLSRLDIGGQVRKPSQERPQLSVFTGTSWGIRDHRAFYSLCSIGIIDNSVRTGVLTFVAFLMSAKGLSEGWVALSIPMIIAGGMCGKLACGFLADRYGVYRTVISTELVTCSRCRRYRSAAKPYCLSDLAIAGGRIERNLLGFVRHDRRTGRG